MTPPDLSRPGAGDRETAPARYVVGIDLGTTNSAVSCVDTEGRGRAVETFPIVQVSAPDENESRESLPSFHYEPSVAAGGSSTSSYELPWEGLTNTKKGSWIVGTFARDQGARIPGRLVGSAKSWLSHTGVDRTASLLPLHGSADVNKISPVTASARYLDHIRRAWNHDHPEHLLEEQDVVVTVPASFDEIARELTVEAARAAGLVRVLLLEEPQAAFYAWIQNRGESWHEGIDPGQKILVCDVGGGTTDLSLIEVRRDEAAEKPIRFHRVAVGDHLILGGDNMDLALAHHIEGRLADESVRTDKLSAESWGILVRQCQRAKELLLGAEPPDRTTLSIPTGGARLVGGALQIEITRAEVVALILDGFFPRAALDDLPTTRTGFQEFGLPFAPDPGITRYTARFLTNAGAKGSGRPDYLLFNGGMFESGAAKKRFLEVLETWFGTDGSWNLQVLENARLDLAVSRGAAYYGLVRRGEGVRISGGLARAYYAGLETDAAHPSALCLVPAGLEPGEDLEIEQEFELRIRQPAEFPIFVSASRTTDEPGDLVPIEPEQLRALPPIRTVLGSGKKIAADSVTVRLRSRLTEVGTLEIGCHEVDGTRRWRLPFDVRSATQTDLEGHTGPGETAGVLEENVVEAVRDLVAQAFGGDPKALSARPEQLVRKLEETASLGRHEWPPSLLREIWASLIELPAGRQRSHMHEVRWLNLLGWSLRPGYGLALDDWRVAQTWRYSLSNKVAHARNEQCRAEWWILWRRVAGGLTAGQQQTIAEPLIRALRGWLAPASSAGKRPKASPSGVPFLGGAHETAEVWRLLGSLEWLQPDTKAELGEMILNAIRSEGAGVWNRAGTWALGRLGARVPQYGPLNTLIPTETVEGWLAQVQEIDRQEARHLLFAAVQMARNTGDRYRDIGEGDRDRVLHWLAERDAPAHFRVLVETGGRLELDEQKAAFGDSLPAGIRLR